MMNIEPTPDQIALIRRAVASGRYGTEEDALRDALNHWERNERARIELLIAFDEAEADIAAGDVKRYERHELPRLAAELKREARRRRAEANE